MKNSVILMSVLLLFLLSSCAAYFNQPTKEQPARFGEEVYQNTYIENLSPVEPIVVGIYKFRDQTGQYKQVENGVSYSTAVTQGATTILIKALEDSKWFVPIERENVSNLLNERQIIRATRKEQSKDKNAQILPPLLFAGILLEGGIISYDTNVITGGAGARYFGAGASTQYRQDRISIYLRAVSTSSGKILKTIYVSKTILSQAIDINFFRFVELKRLLEVETGVSKNEPGQLAVKEAIEKAVESLIVEGIEDGLWQANEEQYTVDGVLENYNKEKEISSKSSLLDRKLKDRRGKGTISLTAFTNTFKGDYTNSDYDIGGLIGYKRHFKDPRFNINLSVGNLTLSSNQVFKKNYLLSNIDFEYSFLPLDKVTPFLYVGAGVYIDNNGLKDVNYKYQYGLGIEYIPLRNLGFRIFAEQNMLTSDNIDGKIHGNYNDFYWTYGMGLCILSGH